jgi:phage shock protein E
MKLLRKPQNAVTLLLLMVAFVSNNSFAADAATPPKATAKPVEHVTPAQAQKLIAEKKLVVLDVRTPEEFKAGHIAGATNINFRSPDFEKRIAGLDKSQPYLVHCAAGGRSTQCLPVLEKHQVTSIYHLDGGMNAWSKAGLPVEK